MMSEKFDQQAYIDAYKKEKYSSLYLSVKKEELEAFRAASAANGTNPTTVLRKQMADYVGIINKGQMLYQGRLSEIETGDTSLEEVFLEMTKGA